MAAPEGNRNAAKERLFYNALTRAIKQEDGKRLRDAAEKLADAAAAGEAWAIKELRDTLDGRPAQTLQGDDERPLRFVQKIELAALGNGSDSDS